MGMASAIKLAENGMSIIIVHRDRRSRLADIEKDFEHIRSLGVQLHSYNVDALNPDVIEATLDEVQKQTGPGSIKLYLHALAKGNLKPIVAGNNDANDTDALEVPPVIEAFYKEKQAAFAEVKAEMKPQDLTLTINSMGINFYDWGKRIYDRGMFSSNARILGLTSEGDKKAWEGYAAVASAKAVMDSLCKYMAIAFTRKGITTNLIQAGVTITESFNLIPGSDFIAESTKLRNPNQRLTTPEDVANVVYMICMNEARWINGTTVIVDGGEHLV